MSSDLRPDADTETASTAERILTYLRRHTRAADTLEGIATWWIGEDPKTKPETVRAALERLAASGLVKARRLATGDWLYSAAFAEPPEGTDPGAGEENWGIKRDEDGNSGRE